MLHKDGEDLFLELKKSHKDYTVFDGHYERIGKVDEIFVDEGDRPLYVGITGGLLDPRSTLVPIEIIRVNDKRKVVEVADSKETVEHAPSIAGEEELTHELEEHVRSYFGLEPLHPAAREPRGANPTPDPLADDARIDVFPGERELDRGLTGDAPRPDRHVASHEHLMNQETDERTERQPGEQKLSTDESNEKRGREQSADGSPESLSRDQEAGASPPRTRSVKRSI